MISATEAARLLNVSPRRVRALCEARRIPGARLLGRDWRIPLNNGAIEVLPGTRGPSRVTAPP
jgi:excisionase family DNA binding protein